MTTVPPEAARLLAELRHPNRLPILIALEARPRRASELAQDLDLDLDAVHWALKTLRKAELVVIQERGLTDNRLAYGIYATTNGNWNSVLAALLLVASTKKGPKPKRRSKR